MTEALTTSIEVDRPAHVVFDYVTDPARFPEWQKGVVEGAMQAAGPVKVGDRCTTVRRIGLAKRPVTAQVTHTDPPRAWGVAGIDGPIRATVDVTVEPIADARSRLTVAIAFVGHGIGRLLVPLLVEREARREMPANLAALKANVERQASTGPSPDEGHEPLS